MWGAAPHAAELSQASGVSPTPGIPTMPDPGRTAVGEAWAKVAPLKVVSLKKVLVPRVAEPPACSQVVSGENSSWKVIYIIPLSNFIYCSPAMAVDSAVDDEVADVAVGFQGVVESAVVL